MREDLGSQKFWTLNQQQSDTKSLSKEKDLCAMREDLGSQDFWTLNRQQSDTKSLGKEKICVQCVKI